MRLVAPWPAAATTTAGREAVLLTLAKTQAWLSEVTLEVCAVFCMPESVQGSASGPEGRKSCVVCGWRVRARCRPVGLLAGERVVGGNIGRPTGEASQSACALWLQGLGAARVSGGVTLLGSASNPASLFAAGACLPCPLAACPHPLHLSAEQRRRSRMPAQPHAKVAGDPSLEIVRADCELRSFQRVSGGAVTLEAADATGVAAAFTRVAFVDNSAFSFGGAVAGERGSALRFDTCTFSGNQAPAGANVALERGPEGLSLFSAPPLWAFVTDTSGSTAPPQRAAPLAATPANTFIGSSAPFYRAQRTVRVPCCLALHVTPREAPTFQPRCEQSIPACLHSAAACVARHAGSECALRPSCFRWRTRARDRHLLSSTMAES